MNLEPITKEELKIHKLFENIPDHLLSALEENYMNADKYMITFINSRNPYYWITMNTIKMFFLRNIVIFNLENLIKFSYIKRNRILFEKYYNDNKQSIQKTASLIARKFSEGFNIKPEIKDVPIMIQNERADTDFFEYKVLNHNSELGLTIESFLNDMGMKGWELVSVKNSTYFFKRKIINDYLFYGNN